MRTLCPRPQILSLTCSDCVVEIQEEGVQGNGPLTPDAGEPEL